jgi:uncharacterized membrane protein YfcA
MIVYVLLFLAGVVFYILSTVGVGDGALMLVPTVEYLLGIRSVSPIINMSNMVGQPARLVLYWRHINWKIVRSYLYGALPGVLLGMLIYFRIEQRLLRNLVGIFLISTVFQFDFGERERSFPMKLEWFGLLGLGVQVLSTLIGAVGPVSNPFYLNYGSDRLEIIATKTFNSFVTNIFKLLIFASSGALGLADLPYILSIGSGAVVGNLAGKYFLEWISERSFRKFVVAGMTLSGLNLLE